MSTVAEKIYLSLKSDIIRGRYRPGEHLRETEISEEMKTSRTPIREALRRLTAEQWVTQVPNSGVTVATWDRDDDLGVFFDLRVLIETFIAEEAARKISDEQIRDLEEIQSEYGRIIDQDPTQTEALQQQNLLFHQVLLDAAGSQWLKKVAGTLVTFPVLLATYESLNLAQIESSRRQHDEILAALRAHSSELAGAIMRNHILAAKVSFFKGHRKE